MKRRHDVQTEKLDERWWIAFDIDPAIVGSRTAKGTSEDVAVANWWALHSQDDKYPRKGLAGYVASA